MIIWGGVTLAAVIGIGGYAAYQWGPANRDRIDTASPHDVRFILNRCGPGDRRLVRLRRITDGLKNHETRAHCCRATKKMEGNI